MVTMLIVAMLMVAMLMVTMLMVAMLIVTMQMMSNGKVVGKDRCLLLFNNMVLCASMKRRKKKGLTARISKSEDLESSTGSR
jgi:hypothetical protein